MNTWIQYIAFVLFVLFCLLVAGVVIYLLTGMFASRLPEDLPLAAEDPYDFEFFPQE